MKKERKMYLTCSKHHHIVRADDASPCCTCQKQLASLIHKLAIVMSSCIL